MTAKHGLGQALRATAATRPERRRLPGARALALDAVSRLLDAGVRDGVLRQDIEPLDVLVASNGAAMAALDPDQVKRLLNYLLDALRARG